MNSAQRASTDMGKVTYTKTQIEELLSQPCLDVPVAGAILGLNRSASYEAAKRGDLETFSIGRLKKVPTAPLRKKLRLVD